MKQRSTAGCRPVAKLLGLLLVLAVLLAFSAQVVQGSAVPGQSVSIPVNGYVTPPEASSSSSSSGQSSSGGSSSTPQAGGTGETSHNAGGIAATSRPPRAVAPDAGAQEAPEVPKEPDALQPESAKSSEYVFPLSSGEGLRVWSILNLLSAVAAFLCALALLVQGLRRQGKGRRPYWARICGLASGLLALLLVLLLEDFTQQMVFVNRWTPVVLPIAIITWLFGIASLRHEHKTTEDEQAPA